MLRRRYVRIRLENAPRTRTIHALHHERAREPCRAAARIAVVPSPQFNFFHALHRAKVDHQPFLRLRAVVRLAAPALGPVLLDRPGKVAQAPCRTRLVGRRRREAQMALRIDVHSILHRVCKRLGFHVLRDDHVVAGRKSAKLRRLPAIDRHALALRQNDRSDRPMRERHLHDQIAVFHHPVGG